MPRSTHRLSSPRLRIPSPFNRIMSSGRKNSGGIPSPKAKVSSSRSELSPKGTNAPLLDNKLEKYTEEELKEYRQVFNMFDTDRSGAIGLDELEAAMKNLGLESTKDQLTKIIDEVDQRGNHEIDFDEFCEVMRRLYEKKSSWNDVIRQCLDVFDQAETGSVTKRDFAWVLREFGDITDMTIIEDIFNESDVDGNGLIDKDEFTFMCRNYLTDDDL
ncbi:hypothetical protein PRIPAC_96663 [Pristionchus pacificus]|uniref:HLH domain-containing protein n=1 Tax=Pristionchus pacificus TaxID=54126 RepID=A0A2A6D1C6_PRIPA|nr:hypothetical protein PRIPAC_96663 [Pristionchus pacificus]|eukprot:PDM84093.1 HLH domain-containing protein [Pristionchus pacificus]